MGDYRTQLALVPRSALEMPTRRPSPAQQKLANTIAAAGPHHRFTVQRCNSIMMQFS